MQKNSGAHHYIENHANVGDKTHEDTGGVDPILSADHGAGRGITGHIEGAIRAGLNAAATISCST